MAETIPRNAAPSVTITGQQGVALQNLGPSEAPNFVIEGDWPADQLRLSDCPNGRAAIVGDCWATSEEMNRTVVDALASDKPERIMTLAGNFSAILARPGRITALSSLSGDHCLYYGQTAAGPTISTRPVLDVRPTPDTAYLTAQLVIPGAESIFTDNSSLVGVSKLPGADMAWTDGGDFLSSTHTQLAPQSGITLTEAAAQLREALLTAVEARMASGRTISADLSGGMDSSSIAFLALRHLGERKLPVFFTNPPNPKLGDALHMERLLQRDSRLEPHRYTRLMDMGRYDYAGMLNLAVAEDLTHTVNLGPREKQYLRDYHEFIDKYQKPDGIHLNGHGGDEVVGSHELYLADAWRSGNLRRFLTDSFGYARLHNVSLLTLCRSMAQLGRSGVRGAFLQAALTLEHLPADDNEWGLLRGMRQPGGPGLQWLTPRARRELAEVLRTKAVSADVHEELSLGDFDNLAQLRCAGQGVHARRQYLRASGSSLSLQAPFLDHDVIRAAFSVGAVHKSSPYEFKRLLRMALTGEVVPSEVVSRRSKGSYDACSARSAVESLPAIQALLHDSLLAELGIIDPYKMREAIQRIDTASGLTLWSLGRVISAELWLRGLGTTQAPQPTSRPSITISATPSPTKTPPIPPTSYLSVPDYVHAVASPEGALVIFNRRTDKYHPLDRTRSEIVRMLALTGSVATAVEAMRAKYANADPDVISAEVTHCCQELLGAGILRTNNERPSTVTHLPTTAGRIRLTIEDCAVAREKIANVKLSDRLLATAGLAIGMIVLKRFKTEHRLPFLQKIQRARCTRDATHHEATRILSAVQSLPSLGRLACLESSYAAALAAAITRRRVDWHQGVSFAPLTSHAWIEAQGQPVTTKYDGQVTGNYQSFYA